MRATGPFVFSRMHYMERRQALRYRVRLPIELEHESGRMRDISESGVFFETGQPFALGQAIQSSMMLAAYPGTPLQLRGEGPVVRVEGRDGTMGVAVALSAVRVEFPEQALSSAEP